MQIEDMACTPPRWKMWRRPFEKERLTLLRLLKELDKHAAETGRKTRMARGNEAGEVTEESNYEQACHHPHPISRFRLMILSAASSWRG